MSVLRVSSAAFMLAIVSFPSVSADKYTMLRAVKATVLVPEDASILAWERIEPEFLPYPRKLVRNGVRGCGVFNFTINQSGRAENVETQVTAPSTGVERTSEKFIESWQWQAKSPNAEPEQVVLRIDYCMGGATQAEADDICEYQATLPCVNKRS
ncbi:energy transducer TonB [Alteromonas oceanisediminis]|uniref:energy transducer TonB n=1 Tax=Alteromonas oceanisediminis TaxID=2836180 RepID=UPI001BD95C37|nr:energy transducer TonB [Alteromonas oceanisediminis]MBT0585123.1 energy transducer TonB [Alteromonas oceanisediminis]